MHFNGQSTVTLDGIQATGYTIAHHVCSEDGTRMMMVAWLHYLDTFTKMDQDWYIAERRMILVRSEIRPLGTPPPGQRTAWTTRLATVARSIETICANAFSRGGC